MDILNNKQKLIIFIIVIFMLLFIGYYIIKKSNNSEYVDIETEYGNLNITEDEEKEEKVKSIIVHITGAVQNQGIVEIESNSRITDVIKEAGRYNRRS